jgi:hypothetical protein
MGNEFKIIRAPIDTWHEPHVICPWCGSVHDDEWDMGLDEDDFHEVECGECERIFFATVNIEVSYTTRRQEQEPDDEFKEYSVLVC